MSGIGTPATASAVPTANAAETAVLTIPFSSGNSANVSLAAPPGVGKVSKNKISGTLNITTGLTVTAVVIKCRQGANTVVGTVVPPAAGLTHAIGASTSGEIPFAFEDVAANFGQAYTITVTQTGGTGAGTVNFIEAHVTDYN